jgi:hypothetical protein
VAINFGLKRFHHPPFNRRVDWKPISSNFCVTFMPAIISIDPVARETLSGE